MDTGVIYIPYRYLAVNRLCFSFLPFLCTLKYTLRSFWVNIFVLIHTWKESSCLHLSFFHKPFRWRGPSWILFLFRYIKDFFFSQIFFFFSSKSVHICSYFLILDFPVFLHELPFFLLLILSHHHYTSYHRFSQEFHLQGDVFFLIFYPQQSHLTSKNKGFIAPSIP